ncbi:hypothetical protein J6590_105269 [Homalodisca vitripennis]|nr:hypothetical protein J6590_105269 [Homalodisca vitripennis]
MEYVRLPRVTVSDYLTNTNVRQLFASRANIVSERRWRRLLFEDASTLQFAKHSPPNTLNVRTNIHELFGQTCSTKVCPVWTRLDVNHSNARSHGFSMMALIG